MRRAAKIDANHAEIVKALRTKGASVQSLAAIGKGCPDLLVAYRSNIYLFEVKDGAKAPSQRKLTPMEKEWIDRWQSKVHIVEDAETALFIILGLIT